MKKISLFITLTLVCLCSGNQAFAQSLYYGELCWKMGKGNLVISNLRLAFSDMGDNHVQVSGRQIDNDLINPKPELYNGNGEIVGDNVVFMLKVASVKEQFGFVASGKFYVSINVATLQGTFNGIVTIADTLNPDPETQTGFDSGYFNVATCPN